MNLDPETLDLLPDETLISASGRYIDGGTFTQCWARPVPAHVAQIGEHRLWEVLVFGGKQLTTSALITSALVLYQAQGDDLDALAARRPAAARRPRARSRVSHETRHAIVRMRAKGMTTRAIEAATGVSRSTVSRIIAQEATA